MVDLRSASLCRICLQDGAIIPIFEKAKNGENILSKLSLCIQHEKIEDVEGLPRHICTKCNNTLNTLCDFIHKFKESCEILENGLLDVLKEDLSCPNQEHMTEVEIDIKNIKAESEDHYDDGFDDYEDLLPLKLHATVKKEPSKNKPIKKEPKTRKIKTQTGIRTNKIASSILEGHFLWNGDRWCVKSGSPITSKKASKEPKPRPQTKIKLPNAKKSTTEKLCDLCGGVFKSNEKLANHKRAVHLKKNPLKCPKCPKILATYYYLSKHIKRKHESSREFICAACGQAFAFKGDLTSHNRNVHDKIRRKKVYACKYCDKTYKCGKSVQIHERSVHTGQRPAECSVCNTSFYHEDYLKEHMRLHTGETPFKCPICGRGYAQRGNMKSHLRIHRISELDAITLSKLKPNYLKLLKV